MVQVLITGLFMSILVDVLPNRYLTYIGLFLLVLIIVPAIGMLRINNKIVKIIASVISISLSISILFGYYYLNKSVQALMTITDESYETVPISVVVLNDSELKEIQDTDQKPIGISEAIQVEDQELLKAEISKRANPQYTNYASVQELMDNLYNKNIQGMLINEGFRNMFEVLDPDFSNKTRVIYSYNIKKEITNETDDTFVITEDAFNIFVSGIDTRNHDMSASNSDVNMIITINPLTKKILLTSIPRDYYVNLHTFKSKDKLTHTGSYGINESILTLQDLLKINIPYYIRVNFDSTIQIIDTLGGVDIYSDTTLDRGTLVIHEGMNHMNGEMALSYARERYAYEGGDRHRVENQQDIVRAVIDKLISPAVITNYSSLLDVIVPAVQTNISYSDILALISMQLNDMSAWDIQTQSLTGYDDTSIECYSLPGTELYVMVPDFNSIETCKKKINACMQKPQTQTNGEE